MSKRTSKPAFTSATSEADKPKLRDKDNAAPRPTPPSLVSRPALNIAPSGMMGIRTGLTPRLNIRAKPSDGILKMRTDHRANDQSYWIEGKITSMKGYAFTAEMQNELSPKGIEGGKILRLDVRKDGDLVMRYNQEWQVNAKTPEHKEALHRIRSGLDDFPQKDFKGFDLSADKDQDFER